MEKLKLQDLYKVAEDRIKKGAETWSAGPYSYWEKPISGITKLGNQRVNLARTTLEAKRSFWLATPNENTQLKTEEFAGRTIKVAGAITLEFVTAENHTQRLILQKLQKPEDLLGLGSIYQLSLVNVSTTKELGEEPKLDVRWVQEVGKNFWEDKEIDEGSELFRIRRKLATDMLNAVVFLPSDQK